jgi:hypothetical protein
MVTARNVALDVLFGCRVVSEIDAPVAYLADLARAPVG